MKAIKNVADRNYVFEPLIQTDPENLGGHAQTMLTEIKEENIRKEDVLQYNT